MGFEPTTSCLEGRNSTAELHPHSPLRPAFPRVGGEGFEPPKALSRQIYSLMQLSTLPSARVTQSYRWESNPQPTVYKTVALPLCYGSGPPGTHNFRRAPGR